MKSVISSSLTRDARYESEIPNCKKRMYCRTAAITKTLGGRRHNRLATRSDNEARVTSENTIADTTGKPATAGESTPGRKLGRPLKKGSKANGESARPWEELFEATLKTADVGPPLIEFKDLREGVVGGEKTWTERVKCLLCGDEVN